MPRIRLDEEKKRILKDFSVFFGMIFGMALILAVLTLMSRNSWRNGLAIEVQHVLDSYQGEQYTVLRNLRLDSSLSTSAAVYSLLKKDGGQNERYYGVIVRIPSILGPLPAVFVYKERDGVFFAGYAVDNGRAEGAVSMRGSRNIIRYWEGMIPQIVAKTESN